MTPAPSGRVQTRLALLALSGLSWTLLAVTFLPGNTGFAVASVSVLIVGAVGWETLQQAGRRLRWDKDWATRSALLTTILEAALAYLVLRALDAAGDSAVRYVLCFGSTWLLIWLVVRGLTRVSAARRRHLGAALPSFAPRHAFGAIGAAVVIAVAVGLAPVPATDPTPSPAMEAAAPGMTHAAPTTRPAPPLAPPPRPVVAVNNPTVRVTPIAVRIPKLGAGSSLIKLGLDANHRMQTPSVTTPMQAGWYEPGPAPGQTGPAVIVGHVDGVSEPGIFYRLHELAPGDRVAVERADGSVLTFVVRRTIHAPKDHFPTGEVYGRTAGPELRLITCGGSFDRTARSYRDNVIVFAQLEGGMRQP
ncbi:class F sortase [Amycolatopsis samaneae]|uniref:Class F sortase n=1 Tax=Amycolatopsis samaneae TaxID=664691 RepID=A0ABW5GG60_9PSEU